MTPQQLLQAQAIDIIFDGRNKQYGAYELRTNYESRMAKALAATAGICVLCIILQAMPAKNASSPTIYVSDTLHLANYEKEKEKQIEIEKPKAKEIVKQIVFTTPTITNKEIPEDEQPPTIDEVNNTQIGTIAVDGIDGSDIVAAPVEARGVGNTEVALPKETDYDGVFATVQIEASFVGGAAAWKKYLERNLNSELPANNGAATGKYSVVVSFVVDKTGRLSDIKAENNPGFGTAEEAIRIIQKSPNWNPANQNGRTVAYRAKQVITFVVTED
jgi:periplasmic protein TonB